ncbi:MAG: Eco57I restriction-modification methylase domain-containing protein [Myxococcota bacterium]|nr:Eco57I restriction-modification methylase domain-containing protein [Myxococcota bacterium]
MRLARQDNDAPLGVVYTPPAIARAMAEIALAPLADRDPLSLRICDPAAGEGVFLDEVVKLLVARGADARAVRETCVFGVDVDARAVARARRITPNVKVGDALAMDWDQAFDLVIGNPPYIRQEHLDKAQLRGFESGGGVADLYIYFIELAHRITRPGGRWCFITPNKWLTAAYGRALRGFLSKRGSVEGVIDLVGERVFDEDAYASITWGTNARSAAPVQAVRGSLASSRVPHDRARWTDEPWHIDEPDDRALIDELEQRWPAFGAVFGTPSRGIVTGANDVFVIDRQTRERLLAEEPHAEALVRPFVKGRDLRPYRAEPDERYILLVDHGTPLEQVPLRYLEPHRERLEPGRGRKPGSYKWYELQDPVGEHSASRAPRLFFQDIQTTPACALDESGLVPDTTVWTVQTSDRFLLALLNSPFYGWYAQRRFPPALNGAVRPKRAYLRALPIAQPSPALHARIDQLVDARLAGGGVDLDLAEAILDAYDLTASQRAVVARASGDRDRIATRRSRAR